MRYSAFEQAAAEAAIGVRELENQLEQLKSQIEQLKGKRDLLDNLSRQLLTLRPTGSDGPSEMAPMAAETAAPAADAAAGPHAPGDIEAEMAAMGTYAPPRSLREEWFSRNGDSGVRVPASDSGIRGRL